MAYESFESVREIVPGALYEMILDREEKDYRRHRIYTLTVGEDLKHPNGSFVAEVWSENLDEVEPRLLELQIRRMSREDASEAALRSLMEQLGIRPMRS